MALQGDIVQKVINALPLPDRFTLLSLKPRMAEGSLVYNRNLLYFIGCSIGHCGMGIIEMHISNIVEF